MITKKEYAGGAARVTLATELASDGVAFQTNTADGWPTGNTAPFVALLTDGTNEEKVLCDGRSGVAFSVQQRGFDGTLPRAWSVGAVVVHVLDAETIQQLVDREPLFDVDPDSTQFGSVQRIRHSTENFLANASFEIWYNGTSVAPNGWTTQGDVTVERIASPTVGSYAAQLTFNGSGFGTGEFYQSVGVHNDVDYTFAIYAERLSGTGNARLVAQEEGGGFTEFVSELIPTGAGAQLCLLTVKPSSGTQLRFSIKPNDSQASVWRIDEAMFQESKGVATTFQHRHIDDTTVQNVYGHKEFSSAGVFNLNVGNVLQAASGSVSAPSYTFAGDADTGMYRQADDTIALTLGGTQRITFRNSDINAVGVNGGVIPSITNTYNLGTPSFAWSRVYIGDGTQGAPAYTFGSDTDTGMYRPGPNELIITVGGGAASYDFTTAYLAPLSNGTLSSGAAAQRWSVVYAATGTINTSDETTKSEITETPLGLDFVLALKPIRWKFNDGARMHDGLGAEQVREALDAVGVEDAALYIDPAIGAKAAGKPKKKDFEDNEAYKTALETWKADAEAPKGLRYSEFIGPLVKAIQEQQEQIEELKAALKNA